MGYYEAAVAQIARERLEATLVCSHCGEANRKGISAVIELDEDGTAYCTNCSHQWRLSRKGPVV